MNAIDLTSSLRTTPMYSLILAPVHAPNLSAPDFLSEKLISYSSPPARAGLAVAVRSSAPSIIAGDSTTTHFFGGTALGFVSCVAPFNVQETVFPEEENDHPTRSLRSTFFSTASRMSLTLDGSPTCSETR